MALWRKPLQFINVMLANRSPMSVAERGPGRMTYAKKKKPFAEHDLRVTLECAGNKNVMRSRAGLSPHFYNNSAHIHGVKSLLLFCFDIMNLYSYSSFKDFKPWKHYLGRGI